VNDAFSPIDAAYAAARWGWYLAAFLLLGAGSYAPFSLRGRGGLRATHPAIAADLTQRAARLGFAAAIALLLLSALRLWLQARTLGDPGEPLSLDFLSAVLGSGWGKGWQRQAVLALLAAPAFAMARRGSSLGWLVAATTSAGLSVTAGMTGHASTTASGSGGMLIDAAHVTAGGLWLGGLGVMFWAGLAACRSLPPDQRPEVLRTLVADFSRRAQILAPLTIGLGVWLAARYLGWRWPLTLLKSSYGVVLGSKIAVLVVVAALGAYNWRITQPRLAREGGESRLRRCSALELIFGVILLGITAVLVALPLPEGGM
jgi:putative copper export protein